MSLKHNLENLQEIAKERTVKTQSIEYDLETLVKKIKKGVIKLDPDYQRRHRWNIEYSSRLIESLVLNIPIPVIYLSYDIDVDAEEEGSRFSVIDGQQRLTAIVNFFENKFALNDLDILTDLEGCFYKDLPPFLIRRLEERSIKCLRIDSTMDPQVKFDIFERLNSGAVKLEPHELRNATQRGPFNDLCKRLSKNAIFRKLTQIPLDDKLAEENSKVKKMEDVELVLRFFALSDENYKRYKKTKGRQFKDFLTERLSELNRKTSEEISVLEKRFVNIITCIHEKFGDNAFAKYKYNADKKSYDLQSNFNAAVYDALIIGYSSEIPDNDCKVKKTHVSKFQELFSDEDFYESVSGSILDNAKIVTRITKARAIFFLMPTYFEIGLASLAKRLVEFDLIVEEARKHVTSNTPLHDALCRSAHVLLVAHFEGHVKQIVKDCLDDVNTYSSFKQSKRHLKNRLCENFIPILDNGKVNHKKVFELIEVLDTLETKFKKDYFLHQDNKNPKATVLDRILKNFGVDDFFNKIKQSKLDLVFSNTLDENMKLCDHFGNLLNNWTKMYPYTIDFDFLEIDEAKKTTDNLWDSFLNNILLQRHNIAHGSLTENSLSCLELQENKIKVQVLIFALSMFICEQCNPN